MSSEEETSLPHQMLGEDVLSPEEKIEKYTGEIDWKYLRPHYESGVLHWVDPELDLATVARAFHQDKASQVADWLGRGDLVKIGPQHAQQWDQATAPRFRATVVTPFVLMQPLP
ncbi:MAG: DUF2288 family protein [Verrucomicrobiota bacterium]